MQHGDPTTSWYEWLEANGNQDHDTKLAALREYIFATAQKWNGSDNITADWLNKKLAKLGISERIYTENRYDITVEVKGILPAAVFASSRKEALEKLVALTDGSRGGSIREVISVAPPVFIHGPEDVDPDAVDPDAPTTVDATLAMFREIVMLGHVAGPKYCDVGANDVLAEYGLDKIPPRRQFTVTRPVEAVMTTVVTAYDEASAERVAGWRWENDRTSYQLTGGEPTADPAVTPATAS